MKYEFKGTPAPWYNDFGFISAVTDERQIEIANVNRPIHGSQWFSKEHAVYNAHLMAAAPDLLEAAINILSDIEDADIWPMSENMTKLKEAIHKALNIKS